jgi:hypothetical protein
MSSMACPRCKGDLVLPLPAPKQSELLRCPHCDGLFKRSSAPVSAAQGARMEVSSTPMPRPPIEKSDHDMAVGAGRVAPAAVQTGARPAERPLVPAPPAPTAQRRAATPGDESRQTQGAHAPVTPDVLAAPAPTPQALATSAVAPEIGEKKRHPASTVAWGAQTSPPRPSPATGQAHAAGPGPTAIPHAPPAAQRTTGGSPNDSQQKGPHALAPPGPPATHISTVRPLANPVVAQSTGEPRKQPSATIASGIETPTPLRAPLPAAPARQARPASPTSVATAPAVPFRPRDAVEEDPAKEGGALESSESTDVSKIDRAPGDPDITAIELDPLAAVAAAAPVRRLSPRPDTSSDFPGRSEFSGRAGSIRASIRSITSPLYRAWSSAMSGIRSGLNRVRTLLTALGRRVKSSALSGIRFDGNRLPLILIVASCAVIAFVIVGLLLRSGGSRKSRRPLQNEPTLAAGRATAPPVQHGLSVTKSAADTPTAVAPVEAPPAKKLSAKAPTPAATEEAATRKPTAANLVKENAGSRHIELSPPRLGVQPHKVAHADGTSKRARSQKPAPPSRGAATTQARSARPAAAKPSAADTAARSREAYKEGNERLFSGQTEAAIKAYQDAVRINREDAAGYRGLGLAYTQAGRKAEAVNAFRRYLKLARTAKDRDIITKRIQILNSQ